MTPTSEINKITCDKKKQQFMSTELIDCQRIHCIALKFTCNTILFNRT